MRALVAAAENGSTVQTVSRGLQVLRAFRSERGPLSNSELVRRTGLPKSCVSRLTSTLLQLGFLNHIAGSRQFELADGPLGLGHAFVETSDFLKQVQTPLQNLANRLGVSTALAVPNGLDMLYVAYHTSTRVATLRLGVGSVLPMGQTAIGRAYLWALPEAEQTNMIERIKRNAGPSAQEQVERGIRDGFAELQSTGTCCVSDGYLRDTFGIAMPVRMGRQNILMGLSCGNAVIRPELTAEHKRITPVLKAAALELQDLMANEDGIP